MRVPTLFIGLGGIGCQIVARLDDLLGKEEKNFVGLVGIDTDSGALSKLGDRHNDLALVQISEDWNVREYLDDHPECEEWFPDIEILQNRTMLEGAGQVRVLSRICCYAAAKNGKFQPIFDEIKRIKKINGDETKTGVNVVFVGSITGGTGSGLFIQMPFYIRENILNYAGVESCKIKGMFVGPDVTDGVQHYHFNVESVRVNGYACLKELNAFYLHHSMDDDHAHNLKIDFFKSDNKSTENVPYDYLYLFEKGGNRGTDGNATIETVIEYISRIAFALVFSPIGDNAVSEIDNFVLKNISTDGMNRYAGAGICRMVFPKKTAQEYITLSVAKQLVKSQWTSIDREYEQQLDAAVRQRETDYTLDLPELADSYVSIFTENVIGDNCTMGSFAKEAYSEDSIGRPYSKVLDFKSLIDDSIQKLVDTEEYKGMDELCKVDIKQFSSSLKRAEDEISTKWRNLNSFTDYASNLVKTKPLGMINNIFPMDVKTMKEKMKRVDICIYNLLASVHPVVARFLIYDFITTINKELVILEEQSKTIDIKHFKETDYYLVPDDNETENPLEALDKIRLLSSFKQNGALKKLGSLFSTQASKQRSVIKNYVLVNTKIALYKLLVDRLTNIGNKYKMFFDTVDDNINLNDKMIEIIEAYKSPIGELGVYASKEAFQTMSQSFISTHTVTLTESAKRSIFEALFTLVSEENKNNKPGFVVPASVREAEVKKLKSKMEKVFAKTVLNAIRTDVIENGGSIVNLTILDALKAEYLLSGSELSQDEYIQNKVQEAINIANPMLLVNSMNADALTSMYYVAMNPSCAYTDNKGDISKPQTQDHYLKNSSNKTKIQVVIEPSFEETEIICMQLKHNFLIEDLVRYEFSNSRGNNIPNSAAYFSRIEALTSGYRDSDGISEVAVNPHLDCNWQEEAIIPSMYSKQRVLDAKNSVKTFIYGLALRYFRSLKCKNLDNRLCWDFVTEDGISHIRKCGNLIDNGYYDLFASVEYNGRIKSIILSEAELSFRNTRKNSTVDVLKSNLLNQDFIKALVFDKKYDSKKIHERNIFDIFFEMKSRMSDFKVWTKLFDGLYEVVYDYCSILFEGETDLIKKSVRDVVEEIYKKCSHNKIDEEDADEVEFKMAYDKLISKTKQIK